MTLDEKISRSHRLSQKINGKAFSEIQRQTAPQFPAGAVPESSTTAAQSIVHSDLSLLLAFFPLELAGQQTCSWLYQGLDYNYLD